MPQDISKRQRAVVLHCAAIVYLLAAFFSATFGAVQPGSAWLSQAAYGVAGLATLYGCMKGARVLHRDLRRRRLIRDRATRLYDRADYTGGHPALRRPTSVLVVLTDRALVLDGEGATVEVPLLRTHQAYRLLGKDQQPGTWLVAQNRFGPRPIGAFDLEFLDAQGRPQRLTLARFRRTTAEQWTQALAGVVQEAVLRSADEGAAAVR